MEKEAQVYIHIPFCVKKCEYCDFLSAPATGEVQAEYVRHLIHEIKTSTWATEGISVPTIFIGGGTPSILQEGLIEKILLTLRETFFIEEEAEITIEINPGTVTKEKLEEYKRAGINRLSIGLQSAQNEELKALGRIHNYDDFLESYGIAREVGFTNINVDLMSALPYQKIDTWKDTLKRVCELKPEHISAYSLIIEEGTPFEKRYREDEKLREKGEIPEILPSEEEERMMYMETQRYLEKCGYHRYEISNYARESYECRHNIGYWVRRDYLGFGLGAASLYQNVRYKNETDLVTYLRGEAKVEAELLTTKAQMEEFMFLGLRLDRGIYRETFIQAFGVELEEIYAETIKRLLSEELLYETEKGYALTAHGLDVSNYTLAQFLLD